MDLALQEDPAFARYAKRRCPPDNRTRVRRQRVAVRMPYPSLSVPYQSHAFPHCIELQIFIAAVDTRSIEPP